MKAVFDALSLSVFLTLVSWVVIQIGVGVALAWRKGLQPWMGAALALIPIPFVGWIAVVVMADGGFEATNDNVRPIERGTRQRRELTDEDVK